jgi:Protein of unknown function (DUF3592)
MRYGLLGPVCLTLGLLAVIWLVLAYRSQRRFMRKALHATGVVQTVKKERWGRQTNYIPIIRFTTASGATVTARPKTSRNGGYSVGQTIPVLYDPDQADTPEIDAFWSRWFVVVVAAFFALVLLGIGGMAIVPPAGSQPHQPVDAAPSG